MRLWEKSVFVNCPYDKQYRNLLRHIIFSLSVMGFSVRMALDNNNNSVSRMDTIETLIQECKFSVHDISYMQASKRKEFARMNMPFELGIDYGYRQFVRKEKEFLIFEKKRYSYHRAISDLSGMDICCHNNKEIDLITCLRDWISGLSGKILPGSKAYWDLYYFDFMWFVHSKRNEWQLDEGQIYNSIPTFKKIVSNFVAELPVSKKELFSVV